MQSIVKGYRGLSLLVDLNADRFLMVGTIALALTLASLVHHLF